MSPRLVVRSAIVAVLCNIAFIVILVAISISLLLVPNMGIVEKEFQGMKNLHVSKETHNELPQIRREIAEIYERDGNLQKTALHVEIAPDFHSTEKVAALTWHNGSDTSYSSDDIEYSNGTFTVNVEGYYYIYSTIRYSGSGTEELNYGRIVHKIEQPTSTLMQNFQSTPVIRRGRLAYTTSSLAGTFFLSERSKVTILSSIPDNIDKSPHGTSFGCFFNVKQSFSTWILGMKPPRGGSGLKTEVMPHNKRKHSV